MENITGNEPAMPSKIDDYDDRLGDITRNKGGLTIRQHFAAIAMQGLLANPEIQKIQSLTVNSIAIEAIQYADALIAELNKPTT
jgi:hypothetical protein